MPAAQVYVKNVDKSDRPVTPPGVSAAIAIKSHKGPWSPKGHADGKGLGIPTLVTNESDFIRWFGEPRYGSDEAYLSALTYLKFSDRLWVTRVGEGDASYANGNPLLYGGLILTEATSVQTWAAAAAGINSQSVQDYTFTGSGDGAKAVIYGKDPGLWNNSVSAKVEDDHLVTSDSASDNTGDGTAAVQRQTIDVVADVFTLTATDATTFTVDSRRNAGATYADATAAASGSEVPYVAGVGTNAPVSFTLTTGATPFVSGDTITITIIRNVGPAVDTNGLLVPSSKVTVYSDNVEVEVFVGSAFIGALDGNNQSAYLPDLIAGSEYITMEIGVDLNANVAVPTSSSNVMPGTVSTTKTGSAVVGAGDGTLTVTPTEPNADADVYTLTATDASTFTVVSAGDPSATFANATIDVEYLADSGTNAPITFTIVDGGTPFEADDVFTLTVTRAEGTTALSGGQDQTYTANTNQIASIQRAVAQLDDVDTYDITLFMTGGWGQVNTGTGQWNCSVLTTLVTICASRMDCMVITGTSAEAEVTTNPIAINGNCLLNETAAIKIAVGSMSSFAAAYGPRVKVFDSFTGKERFVLADGYECGIIATADYNGARWAPPAGWRRGGLAVMDVRYRLTKAQMGALYDAGLNPIRYHRGKGISIWGDKTLQTRPSALDRISTRLLLTEINPVLSETLDNFLFEVNTEETRLDVWTIINDYMARVKARNGVYEFRVVCDESNNLDADIDANRLNVWLFIKPVKSINWIHLSVIITRTGASLQALANAGTF